jgi:hypothetical protein
VTGATVVAGADAVVELDVVVAVVEIVAVVVADEAAFLCLLRLCRGTVAVADVVWVVVLASSARSSSFR